MSTKQRILWPLSMGAAGSLFLTAVYFAIVSWAESYQHALDLFWQDRWLVLPLVLGFGVQVGLYTVLKQRLFVQVPSRVPAGAMTGAGGATSTVAMIACCTHHVADVLPILGFTAAAAFLAQYQQALMLVGLGTTLVGILVMVWILFRERRKAMEHMKVCLENL